MKVRPKITSQVKNRLHDVEGRQFLRRPRDPVAVLFLPRDPMAVIFLPPEPVSLLVLVGHVLSNAEQCSLSVVTCPFVSLLLVWLKILPESRQGVFGGDPF